MRLLSPEASASSRLLPRCCYSFVGPMPTRRAWRAPTSTATSPSPPHSLLRSLFPVLLGLSQLQWGLPTAVHCELACRACLAAVAEQHPSGCLTRRVAVPHTQTHLSPPHWRFPSPPSSPFPASNSRRCSCRPTLAACQTAAQCRRPHPLSLHARRDQQSASLRYLVIQVDHCH